MPATISIPTDAETDHRLLRLAELNRLVVETFGRSLAGGPSDVELLQRVLDENVYDVSDTFELQTVGLALGDAIRSGLGLHWVMVEDEHGRDPALGWKQTSLLVFPLTMVSKRLERGERVVLEVLVDALERDLPGIKGQHLDRA